LALGFADMLVSAAVRLAILRENAGYIA